LLLRYLRVQTQSQNEGLFGYATERTFKFICIFDAFLIDIGIKKKRKLYIVNPKAAYHITQQVNICASVRYPIWTVKQATLLTRWDDSLHIIFENRRRNVISLNQPRDISAKMAAMAYGFKLKCDKIR